jgi:hypothetical protein
MQLLQVQVISIVACAIKSAGSRGRANPMSASPEAGVFA